MHAKSRDFLTEPGPQVDLFLLTLADREMMGGKRKGVNDDMRKRG